MYLECVDADLPVVDAVELVRLIINPDDASVVPEPKMSVGFADAVRLAEMSEGMGVLPASVGNTDENVGATAAVVVS